MTLEMVYQEKFAEGKAEGIAEGKAATYASLIRSGLLTIQKAVELSGIPEETLQTYVDKRDK